MAFNLGNIHLIHMAVNDHVSEIGHIHQKRSRVDTSGADDDLPLNDGEGQDGSVHGSGDSCFFKFVQDGSHAASRLFKIILSNVVIGFGVFESFEGDQFPVKKFLRTLVESFAFFEGESGSFNVGLSGGFFRQKVAIIELDQKIILFDSISDSFGDPLDPTADLRFHFNRNGGRDIT